MVHSHLIGRVAEDEDGIKSTGRVKQELIPWMGPELREGWRPMRGARSLAHGCVLGLRGSSARGTSESRNLPFGV